MTNRIGHVDIAKGISIILVAIFHSKLKSFAPEIVNSMNLFRIPLFFFLSGVFFSVSTETYTFLWKKSDALLKPYFATSLITFFVAALSGKEHLAWRLGGIFYGNGDTIRWTPMWFLTHLFSVYVFTYFVFKIVNIQEKKFLYKYIFLAMLMVAGTQWIDAFWFLQVTLFGKEVVIKGLPFSFDIVLITSAFFIAGTFIKKRVISFNPNLYILSLSVLVFFAVTMLTNADMDLNKRIYISPVFATAGAICGVYFVICISFYINKIIILRNIFLTFGQASLFILIFHEYIGDKVYQGFIRVGMIGGEFWLAFTAFLISIFIPVLIKTIVLKSKFLSLIYLPVKPKNLIRFE